MKKSLLFLAIIFSFSMPTWAQSSLTESELKIKKIQDLAKSLEPHGLLYSLYFNPTVNLEIDGYLATQNQLGLDMKLSAIVNQIASDLSRGRVLPSQLTTKTTIKVKNYAHKVTADAYLKSDLTPEQFIQAVAPKNNMYKAAQTLVADLISRKAENRWMTQPASLSLAVVSSKTTNRALIEYIRNKLKDFGYENNTSHLVYDEELNAAIRSFQAENGLDADGVAGSKTWALLNKNLNQLITQAILNLDRVRWLPDQISNEYIYVNLARQEFKMFRNDIEILNFKTINGRLDRQTPMMIDIAKSVVLNPTWTVPRNLFVKDKLPILKADPGYVARTNMKLYSDITGLEVDPYTVDWNQDPTTLAYTLVQQPGPGNALGFIKFPLTNGFAIYLHDTNERNLFTEANRLRSSGCIRLEKPFEFAEALLNNPKYTAEALRQMTEFLPTPATKQSYLAPAKSVPVYLFYQTITSANGKILASADSYEIDAEMYNLLMLNFR